MGLKSKSKVDPSVIRALFGDSLRGLWFPDYTDDGGNVLDQSGNGNDAEETSSLGIVEPVAPRMTGSSWEMEADSARVFSRGIVGASDFTDSGFTIGGFFQNEPGGTGYVGEWQGGGPLLYIRNQGFLQNQIMARYAGEGESSQNNNYGTTIETGYSFFAAWSFDSVDGLTMFLNEQVDESAGPFVKSYPDGGDLFAMGSPNFGGIVGLRHGPWFLLDRAMTKREAATLVNASGVLNPLSYNIRNYTSGY